MNEWWSIEVFDASQEPARRWKDAHEDALTEAAITHGALYWEWSLTKLGVIFEVCFATDDQWQAFKNLPLVSAALDDTPDPVNGLIIYRGRGGAAGSRKPRKPRPAPGASAMKLPEPVVEEVVKLVISSAPDHPYQFPAQG
jgi:hypothetical protein